MIYLMLVLSAFCSAGMYWLGYRNGKQWSRQLVFNLRVKNGKLKTENIKLKLYQHNADVLWATYDSNLLTVEEQAKYHLFRIGNHSRFNENLPKKNRGTA